LPNAKDGKDRQCFKTGRKVKWVNEMKTRTSGNSLHLGEKHKSYNAQRRKKKKKNEPCLQGQVEVVVPSKNFNTRTCFSRQRSANKKKGKGGTPTKNAAKAFRLGKNENTGATTSQKKKRHARRKKLTTLRS